MHIANSCEIYFVWGMVSPSCYDPVTGEINFQTICSFPSFDLAHCLIFSLYASSCLSLINLFPLSLKGFKSITSVIYYYHILHFVRPKNKGFFSPWNKGTHYFGTLYLVFLIILCNPQVKYSEKEIISLFFCVLLASNTSVWHSDDDLTWSREGRVHILAQHDANTGLWA